MAEVKLDLDFVNSQMGKNLGVLGTKMGAAILMYCATEASRIESVMKVNRPWTDRTGMAKARLNVKVSQPSDAVVRMTLAHGVDYGIWLELAHEKRFAIINPTLTEEGPRVVEGLQGILGKIKL